MADVPAARHTLRALSLLATRVEPMRASEIAAELGLPRSTTYDLLGVMREERFVVHYPERRSYGLSPVLQHVAVASETMYRLEWLVAPLLSKMIKRLGMPLAAQSYVLRGSEVHCIAETDLARVPTLAKNTGTHRLAHLTASGRAILSTLPHHHVRTLYPNTQALADTKGQPLFTLAEFDRVLREAATQGWAIQSEEITKYHATLAVACVPGYGLPPSAISVTFRVGSIDPSHYPLLGKACQATAHALRMRVDGRL